MSLKIKDIKIKVYERVIYAINEITKLDCITAIHNTKLGPALGCYSIIYTDFSTR